MGPADGENSRGMPLLAADGNNMVDMAVGNRPAAAAVGSSGCKEDIAVRPRVQQQPGRQSTIVASFFFFIF